MLPGPRTVARSQCVADTQGLSVPKPKSRAVRLASARDHSSSAADARTADAAQVPPQSSGPSNLTGSLHARGRTRARVRPARVRAGADDEFATRLRAFGVTPQRDDVWLMVGKPTRVAGWKLHVSSTVTGVELLFERVLPCLVRHRAHFKIAAERGAIVQM